MGDAGESPREQERGGRAQIHRLAEGGRLLSFGEAWERLAEEDAFRDRLTSLLAGAPWPAFFWETPPVARGRLERSFECALLDAPGLAGVTPDPRAFAERWRAGEDVAVFENLGGDALLVAPAPSPDVPAEAHAHFAAWVRRAPPERTRALWRAVALAVRSRLSDRPLWVSTSGLGVAWLHVRLDSRPKYYQHAPYARCR